VAAGTRATAGDPGDAEGWLILGSAQQELGHAAAAREAFRSCVKSAKRGPVGECAAMLR
jgi:cytochrome c-type biogenesis protein CcmH/NrfG